MAEAELSCNICSKLYKTVANLRQHLGTHSLVKRFRCDYPGCGKTFNQASHKAAHSRVHTDETPFECNLCPFASKTKSDLNRHARTHTGVKPFSCDICLRAYTQKHSLRSHRCRGRTQEAGTQFDPIYIIEDSDTSSSDSETFFYTREFLATFTQEMEAQPEIPNDDLDYTMASIVDPLEEEEELIPADDLDDTMASLKDPEINERYLTLSQAIELVDVINFETPNSLQTRNKIYNRSR